MPPPRLSQTETFIKYLSLTADRLMSDLGCLNVELSKPAKRKLIDIIDQMRDLAEIVHEEIK